MVLNSCEHGDSIVVYAGVHCPVCEMEDEIANLQDQVATLEGEYDSLEDDYSIMEGELNDLKTN